LAKEPICGGDLHPEFAYAGSLDLKKQGVLMVVQGDDIVFTMGSDELTLRDVSKSAMNAGDFLFA